MLLLISLLRLLIQEPCLLEVDLQTRSAILLANLSHVLVHSSCQLFTVIRDGINSFDALPPLTSLPYSRMEPGTINLSDLAHPNILEKKRKILAMSSEQI